jgi:hypothetical protein
MQAYFSQEPVVKLIFQNLLEVIGLKVVRPSNPGQFQESVISHQGLQGGGLLCSNHSLVNQKV